MAKKGKDPNQDTELNPGASAAETATAVQDNGNPSEENPTVEGGAAEPSDSAGASVTDSATAVQGTGNPSEENPAVDGGAEEPSDSAGASVTDSATAVQGTGNPSEENPAVDGGAEEPSDSADASMPEIGGINPNVLECIAKRTMRDHGLDSVYVTSDGTAFYTRHDAHNHARNLSDDTILAIEPQTTIEG